MISAFANVWKVPELRDRLLFTLGMVVICRLGVYVTIPGIDTGVLSAWVSKAKEMSDASEGSGLQTILGIFSGGALEQAGIFALGIMPYISAAIMMQLMTAVVPKLSRLSREDNGRQKIGQYTRYLTIGIALVQGIFVAKSLIHPENMPYMQGIGEVMNDMGRRLVLNPTILWQAICVMTLVTGALLLMWIGDQMTERGIGNGTSLIITVNIIAAMPGALFQAWQYFVTGDDVSPVRVLNMVLLIALFLLVTAGTVALTEGQRRIAVQYAKRVVGRKQFGGQTQYLPLLVNYSNVMPIIFAYAVLSLPPILASQIFQGNAKIQQFVGNFPNSIWYFLVSAGLIFFFSYFWVSTMFQPSQVAEDMKRNGGYIPGVRPGKPTADFLDFTMTRLTFAGSCFLTILFIIPVIIGPIVGLPAGSMVLQFFGGTSLLIMVAVMLDVMRQAETHLIQHNYDGFLRKGKMKNRYNRMSQVGSSASTQLLVYLWTFIGILLIIAAVAYFAN